MSRLVILGAFVFDTLYGKTNKQTNRHTNAAEHPTHATIVGVVTRQL